MQGTREYGTREYRARLALTIMIIALLVLGSHITGRFPITIASEPSPLPLLGERSTTGRGAS